MNNKKARAQATAILKRPIPRTGEMLPAVGVGTWQTFDVGVEAPERAELKEVLRLLVEGGGSVVDSSPMYGEAERVVGDLSAELRLREKLFFATKVWTRGRDAGIRQMESSLKLTEIAARVGYSELSAFSRASRRWFGTSPRSFRRRSPSLDDAA